MAYVEQNPEAIGQAIVTTADYQVTALDTDWHYALGSYRYWVSAKDIKCSKLGYTMVLTYSVRDNYDWDINSTLGAGGLPWGGNILYDSDMAKLHRLGVMREYEVEGSHTVTVTWKKGQRVGSGAQVTVERRRPL